MSSLWCALSDDSPLAGNRKVATTAAHCVISLVLKTKTSRFPKQKRRRACALTDTHRHTHRSSRLTKTPLKEGFGATYSCCDWCACFFFQWIFIAVQFLLQLHHHIEMTSQCGNFSQQTLQGDVGVVCEFVVLNRCRNRKLWPGFTPTTQTQTRQVGTGCCCFSSPQSLSFTTCSRLPLLTAGSFKIKGLAHFIVQELLLLLVSDVSEPWAPWRCRLHPSWAAFLLVEALILQQKQKEAMQDFLELHWIGIWAWFCDTGTIFLSVM